MTTISATRETGDIFDLGVDLNINGLILSDLESNRSVWQ